VARAEQRPPGTLQQVRQGAQSSGGLRAGSIREETKGKRKIATWKAERKAPKGEMGERVEDSPRRSKARDTPNHPYAPRIGKKNEKPPWRPVSQRNGLRPQNPKIRQG